MDLAENKIQLVVSRDIESMLDRVALLVNNDPYYQYLHSMMQYNFDARDGLRSSHTQQLKRLFEMDIPEGVRLKCNKLLAEVIAVERELNTKRRITISKAIVDIGDEAKLYMKLADLNCTFEPYSGPCDFCNKPIERVCMVYNSAKIHIKSCTAE
jgi:hypothetical protein